MMKCLDNVFFWQFQQKCFLSTIWFWFFSVIQVRTITLYFPFFLSCPLDFMLSFNGRTQRKRDHVLYIFFINHSPPSPSLSLFVCNYVNINTAQKPVLSLRQVCVFYLSQRFLGRVRAIARDRVLRRKATPPSRTVSALHYLLSPV